MHQFIASDSPSSFVFVCTLEHKGKQFARVGYANMFIHKDMILYVCSGMCGKVTSRSCLIHHKGHPAKCENIWNWQQYSQNTLLN